MAIVVSFGGGVNSTAMIIKMVKEDIRPNAILFADTGGEKPETYSYIKYFNDWLEDNKFPLIQIVKYKTKEGVELTLEQDILNNNTIPSIAFGWKTCSQKFKIRPQEKWIAEQFPNSFRIVHYIGFDSGEERRVKANPIKNHENVYPLIMWGWDRKRCEKEIVDYGLRLPPKSSCYFCPNMHKNEILALSDELKGKVKVIEKNATKLIELKGLGRRFSWTKLIEADADQIKAFDDLDVVQTPCECID